jgi:hypothetical protein
MWLFAWKGCRGPWYREKAKERRNFWTVATHARVLCVFAVAIFTCLSVFWALVVTMKVQPRCRATIKTTCRVFVCQCLRLLFGWSESRSCFLLRHNRIRSLKYVASIAADCGVDDKVCGKSSRFSQNVQISLGPHQAFYSVCVRDKAAVEWSWPVTSSAMPRLRMRSALRWL